MKLLLDENLSPALAVHFAEMFPGTAHVHHCALGNSTDDKIWSFARTEGFVITSKDRDFEEKSILLGQPPKVIRLRVGNSNTETIRNLIVAFFTQIEAFWHDDGATLLLIP